MTITVFLMKQNSKIIEIINHSNSAHHHQPIHHHYSDHHQEECVHGGRTFPQTDNYYYHRGNNYHHSHHSQHRHQNRKSPKQPNNTVHPFLFLFIAKSIMTGDKVEVHNEPSSILSEGQRDDSNGTAQSHSQQSTQPNTNNDNTNTNTNTNNNSHNCKNNWWNCCCCCCSCISIKHQTEKNVENKVQLSSIENYFNDDDEPPPNLEEIRSWAESFDKMMKCKYGRKVFRDFLRCEYSEENIMFWLACEDLKKESNPDMIEEKARLIYEDFISILSPREVSLDSRVREIINKNMIEPTPNTFDEAQIQIYTLMHRDSFPRFINSSAYRQLAQLPTTSRKTSSTS